MSSRNLLIFFVFVVVVITGEYLIYLFFQSLGISESSPLRNIFLSLGFFLPTFFVGGMFYGAKHFSILNSWLYTIGAIWLGLLTYLVMATFCFFILTIFNQYFNLPTNHLMFFLIAFAFSLTIYGVYNASTPKIVRYEISSPTLFPLWKNKKIVFISDVHLGMIRREKFMQKIINLINKEKPDITFNLGDLIDGSSFPYQKGFAPLSLLQSKLGNYYVEGNHEGYSQESNLFRKNFPPSLIDITNQKIIINQTQIIGLPFNRAKNQEQINQELIKVSYDKNLPSIILMHDPKNNPELISNSVSLVLSGHTHAGQFFPFTFLLSKIKNKYFYGLTYTNKTASLTSSGVGTSMVPLRIRTRSEIVIISIK